MHILDLIKKTLDRILIWACIILCGLMVITVSWQVITRFIFNNPSAISEALANIFFVWMGLLGAALLYGEKGHMNINFIPEKLGPYKSQVLLIISEFATLGIALWVLTYGGYKISLNAMTQTDAAMPWLMVGQIYMVVPIVGVCVVFYSIYNIINAVRILVRGPKAQE